KKLEELYGIKSKGYGLDIKNVQNIKKVFEEIGKDFKTLDVFVANGAHLGVDIGLLGTDESDFEDVINTNIKGTFFCCQAAAEIMKKQLFGSIVTMGSVQALGAVRGRTAYSMTKAAISALVKNMAYELGEYNIRANNLVAGAIHSTRWDVLSEDVKKLRRSRYPLGRESTEEEIANAVYFLGSELSSSMTGTDMVVDSGVTTCLLPYTPSEEKR
ncbi:MAG: SDR family oxidoreductase, partial [Clostridia bacterium]|nr:SDR family oxidoreductase [Clostridia bacterium]